MFGHRRQGKDNRVELLALLQQIDYLDPQAIEVMLKAAGSVHQLAPPA